MGRDDTIKIWDPHSGYENAAMSFDIDASDIAWGPEGQRLYYVANSVDGNEPVLEVLDASEGYARERQRTVSENAAAQTL